MRIGWRTVIWELFPLVILTKVAEGCKPAPRVLWALPLPCNIRTSQHNSTTEVSLGQPQDSP